MPTVADLDAHSRASGNRHDVAIVVGERIFATRWPVQVLQVEANDIAGHLVLGLRVSGVKFHEPVRQADFYREVSALVSQALAAAPAAEEVDLWVTVPIAVGKGVIVSGDLAKPTTRTVFTVTSTRREKRAALDRRLRSGANIYIDEEWARSAFKKTP